MSFYRMFFTSLEGLMFMTHAFLRVFYFAFLYCFMGSWGSWVRFHKRIVRKVADKEKKSVEKVLKIPEMVKNCKKY